MGQMSASSLLSATVCVFLCASLDAENPFILGCNSCHVISSELSQPECQPQLL